MGKDLHTKCWKRGWSFMDIVPLFRCQVGVFMNDDDDDDFPLG